MRDSLRDYPLAQILAGMRQAWLIVLGPLAAICAGMVVGCAAAGHFSVYVTIEYWFLWPALLIGSMSADLLGIFLLLAVLFCCLWFRVDENRRAEAFFAILTASAIQTWRLASRGAFDWLDALRIGVAVVLVAAAYGGVKCWPRIAERLYLGQMRKPDRQPGAQGQNLEQ